VHNFLVTSEVSVGHVVVMFMFHIYFVYVSFMFIWSAVKVMRIGIHWQGKVYENS
jgi:hypothetical protein